MERGGSNLSDKGLNSVDRGSKATLPLTIPRRVFKSPAKDSTRRRGNNNSRRSERRSRTDLANDTRLWEPKLLPRVGNRAAGTCVASSPDSDLEAFSHNPAHGSFAPLAFQPSAMTNCANQRFLSHSDVPPQPNSPPDNVLRSIDPPASLGSKRRGCYPASGSRILSWLFDAQETPESCSQSVPGRHATRRLAALAARAVRQQSTGSNWDLRAQPSEPILFRLRIHFADFLAYIVPSTRGCSPWRPDAVMSTTGVSGTRSSGFSRAAGMHRHHATRGALPAAGPYLRLSRFQGGQAVKQKR
ncbi:hypothetical protein Bca101_102261 [Brassica carinata]